MRSLVPNIDLGAWRYYLRCYRGLHRDLLLSLLASMGQSLVAVLIAWLIRYVFDTVIPADNFSLLVRVGLGLLALHLVDVGATFWIAQMVVRATGTAVLRVREDLLRWLYSVSRSYYTEADRGALHSQIVNDTLRLERMGNSLVSRMVPSLLVGVGLGAVLIYLNWVLFLVMLCLAPLLLVLNRFMASATGERIRDLHRAIDVFSKGILTVLQRMDLTRIQSSEAYEIERQGEGFAYVRDANARMTWLTHAYQAVNLTAIAVFGALILIVGGWSVGIGRMTLGALLSYYAAFGLLSPRLRQLYLSIPHLIAGNASLLRMHGLLTTGDARPYSGTRRIDFRGKVSLEGVSFRYKGDQDIPVVQDIDLTILPGSTVAVIGPNGSGKSTIAHLILGFYRPQEGRLTADNQPYDQLDIPHLRGDIGVVTQDPILLPGTVLDNIMYGYPDTDQRQVVEAARMATAHEFIEQLPEGYETRVGEEGVLLSGGQRQRIAIARALLRRPMLLVLDEPTNHLDEDSVRQLLHNLSARDNPPASLIISHDPVVVSVASRIYTLDEGRIVSSGAPVLTSGGAARSGNTQAMAGA